MIDVKLLARVTLAILSIASLAACSKVQARTPEQVVALNTPPPPARVTIPIQLPDPEPEPSPAPPTAAATPATTTRPRSESTTAKPATPPASPPAAETPPAGPVLQTTPNTGALAERTNGLLKEAQTNLDRIKYSDISVQARAQYDQAKSFIKTAGRALHDKNFTYAEYLAAKAAAIAKELAKG